MFKSNRKKLLLIIPLVLILSGCSNEPITANPDGLWSTIILWFGSGIVWLSDLFGNNLAWGIILSTVVLRLVQIPLYASQLRSTEAMAAVKPEMDEINNKYKNKGSKEDQAKKQQEIMAVYQRHKVNPLASCFPLLIQMPIIFLYYGSLQGLILNNGTEGLTNVSEIIGSDPIAVEWLIFDLSSPSILLAALAAITTFTSFNLSTIGRDNSSGGEQAEMMMKMMKFMLPGMIFISGMALPAALALYWVTNGLLMIIQTLIFRRTHITNHMIMQREKKKSAKK